MHTTLGSIVFELVVACVDVVLARRAKLIRSTVLSDGSLDEKSHRLAWYNSYPEIAQLQKDSETRSMISS